MRSKSPTWKAFAKTKIFDLDTLLSKLAPYRAEGQKVATLNGSFDLLHAGHLHIFYEASQQADIFVVALNTDASIKRYKSPTRPIIPLQERMEMVAALLPVDFVTWFDEDDPRALLAKIHPDVHVNGSEYGSECIEAEVVQKHGGRIHIVEKIPGLATSQIISTIKKVCD
jgi:rfaE bifunctional protein nucleotidyltransferase chain/domain